eukprot:TRINITY_DN11214_c0_g1_i1.p2 TRINITY_DN11214_c0_g1~~TRINITY_DN11214_c0_g1_i1.p2  ORF type:complete len:284 (+),score=75.95 TRINITY_DN11214_c0_g1_i1:115-966(+)
MSAPTTTPHEAGCPGYVSDMFSLEGRTAVVTGGGRGIGRMVSEGLIQAHVASLVICSRNAAALAQAANELRALAAAVCSPTACVAVQCDVASKESVEAFVSALTSEHNIHHVDILVNNSGTNFAAPFGKYPDAAWDKVLSVNVKAVFALTQALGPLLRARATPSEPSRVINIGSIDGFRVSRLETYAYGASKAAVHHLTHLMASHLASQHITVNAIAAGAFESKMMKETLARHGDEIEKGTPLGRIGRPEDVAGLVVYLSSAGRWMTGAVLPLDGGVLVRSSL